MLLFDTMKICLLVKEMLRNASYGSIWAININLFIKFLEPLKLKLSLDLDTKNILCFKYSIYNYICIFI